MKRNLVTLLLVVVLLFSCTYAGADDIDLTGMTDLELNNLRKAINEELNRRKEERIASMEFDPSTIRQKYDKWLDEYDFNSILSDLESGQHGMTEACAADVKAKAEACKAIMELCSVDSDAFTGETKITYTGLEEIGSSHVYPFIDYHGLNLIVGFPYEDSFHYDQIYLKCGEDITEYDKYERDRGFDIQFETLNGEHWEYSTLVGIYLDDNGLEAVSFREEGSVRKVDYELTKEESAAAFKLYKLKDTTGDIRTRIQHWSLSGE